MHCIYCGKPIQEDAVFCTYCGKNIKQEAYSGDLPFSDEPPKYIEQLNFAFDGPSERLFLGGVKRGFAVSFSLADKLGVPTRSNGEAEITLSPVSSGGFSGFFDSLLATKRFTFSVGKEDFKPIAIEYRGNHPGRRKFFGYLYRNLKPDFETHLFWVVKISFKTPDGRKLYADDTSSPRDAGNVHLTSG